jgi:lysyl-tRNA synthetase class 2
MVDADSVDAVRAELLLGHAYPHFQPTASLEDFADAHASLEPGARVDTAGDVLLAGRIVAKREASSKLYFYDIVSHGEKLQVLAEHQHYDDPSRFRRDNQGLRRGDVVGVRGFPGKSNRGELSVIPRSIELLAPCQHPLPDAQKEGLTDVNTRYRQRYLDLLVNKSSHDALVVRSLVVSHIRRFLETRGFLEVETPVLYHSSGGAMARPFVTRSEALDCDLKLRVAPELFLKQLVVGGMNRVFEIGKVFRNEGLSVRHSPEFTMLECYAAFADYEDFMRLVEELLSGMVEELTGSTCVEVGEGASTRTLDFTPPFRRLPVMPALNERLARLEGGRVQLPDPASSHFPAALADACRVVGCEPDEPATVPRRLDALVGELLEAECEQPTFIVDHPTVLSPLAKQHWDDPGLAQRFELVISRREVANAYSELNDPAEQRRRFKSQQKDRESGDNEALEMDEAYCRALEYGLPPTAGLGIGVDRLCMLLAQKDSVREVQAFPVVRRQDA